MVGTDIVPFSQVGNGPNYTLYEANISAWAAETEQLTFSAEQFLYGQNNWELDNISFSAVSEPDIPALTAIGGLLLAGRMWFGRRRLVS